jgi:tetrahydromethanopterin S-methyltransferase subunit B
MVTNIEKESLEAHVELCAERYDRMAEKMENLENRLDNVEAVLKEIKGMLTQAETQAYKKIISIGITVIGALMSTLLGLVIYLYKHGAV